MSWEQGIRLIQLDGDKAVRNVDILKTDFTAWQDMSRAARAFVNANKLDDIAFEDDDGEPCVIFILPAGSIDTIDRL